MKKRKISWDIMAINQVAEFILHTRKHTPKAAKNLKRDILKKIGELAKQPEVHAPDKFKKNNAGHYRAFELHLLRISYIVKENEVIITHIRQKHAATH